MKAGIIAFSERGMRLAEKIAAFLNESGDAADAARCEADGLYEWTRRHFSSDGALVFISSCGIAVRAAARYLDSKTSDPAVVVIDELGTFAVALLSGHIGGANALAQRLAKELGAMPVITTATDTNGVFALDAWAAEQDMAIVNPERIKTVAARQLSGEIIRVDCRFPVAGSLPEGFALSSDAPDVVISCRHEGGDDALRLAPRVITLGVGCKKGTSAEAIEEAFKIALDITGCLRRTVRRVCSIDLKANEAGLVEFCRLNDMRLITFTADELTAADGVFSSSEFVRSAVGADNVCERAAALGGGELILNKTAHNGVTVAMAQAPYAVSFGGE